MEVILPQKYLMTISGKSTYEQISVQSEPGKDTYVYNRINKILENKPFAEMESKLSYIENSQKLWYSSIEIRHFDCITNTANSRHECI
jgi:putative ABC transport system permease protein